MTKPQKASKPLTPDLSPKKSYAKFPMFPFKSKAVRIDEPLFFTPDHTNIEMMKKAGGGIRMEPPSEDELELIDQIVDSRVLFDIKRFLRNECCVDNVTGLKFDEIISELNLWRKRTNNTPGGSDIDDSGSLKIESLNWDSVLKSSELKQIEQQYETTADDLSELADLITDAQEAFHKELIDKKIILVGFPSEPKSCEMHIRNKPTGMIYPETTIFGLGRDTYKIVVRIHFSMHKLKHILRNTIGSNAASDFYDRVRDSLQYSTIDGNYFSGDPSTLIFCGDEIQDGKTKIDRILMDLKEWHEISLSRTNSITVAPEPKEKQVGMGLDEILECIGIEAETFLQPQFKAEFKQIIDPYFEEVSRFKENLNPYVLELKDEIDKYQKTHSQSKLLDMYNKPGKDYINCSNHIPSIDAPYFDVYHPDAEYGYIWGWMPQKAYLNDPLSRLLSYAGWPEPEKKNLAMFQFAIVAILHDAPRLENGCNLIYFGSGDDLADRAALEFMKVLYGDKNRRVKTPFARTQIKRVLDRLKNALDTVKIKLADDSNRTKIAGTELRNREPVTQEEYQDFLCRIAKQVDLLLIDDNSAMGRFRKHLQNCADGGKKHLKWKNEKMEQCLKSGETYVESSNMNVPDEFKSPLSMLVIDRKTKNLPEPRNKEEGCQRYYIILASIHDYVLSGTGKIDNGILSEDASHFIMNSFLNEIWDTPQRRTLIEQALERVKAEKPVVNKPKQILIKEIEQGTKPEQLRSKWLFNDGQVLYDQIDLDISGLKLDVLDELVKTDGLVVTKSLLDGVTSRYAHYIGDIRKILKAKYIPCEIKTVTGEGYKLIYTAE